MVGGMLVIVIRWCMLFLVRMMVFVLVVISVLLCMGFGNMIFFSLFIMMEVVVVVFSWLDS